VQGPREHVELYHEWRSTGAKLAVPQGSEQKALDGACDALKFNTDQLYEYLEPISTLGRAQSYAMLLKVVKEAVQLDLKMQQQRAYFLFWGNPRLRELNRGRYDPELMEVRFGDVSDRRNQYMELLIAPALMKQGNSDGRDYTGFLVIEKAQVDIAVPPQKRRGFLSQ
jgi:hypothetical protein